MPGNDLPRKSQGSEADFESGALDHSATLPTIGYQEFTPDNEWMCRRFGGMPPGSSIRPVTFHWAFISHEMAGVASESGAQVKPSSTTAPPAIRCAVGQWWF